MTAGSFSAVIITTVLLTIAAIAQHNGRNEAFERIMMGDHAADVISLLGEPDSTRNCGSTLYWGGDHKPLDANNGRCVVEYFYASSPGGWSVGFDNVEKVVSKYVYVSP